MGILFYSIDISEALGDFGMFNRNVDISQVSEDIGNISLIRLFRDLNSESGFYLEIVHYHNL